MGISKSHLRQSDAELVDKAALDLGFTLLAACAVAIATLGFGMNSPAVIVGSMVVSPLLYVAIAIAAAGFHRDWPGLRRSLITLLVGIAVGVTTAFIVAALSPVSQQSEIADRLHTGWGYYFAVAGVAGFAGTVAFYWPGTQESLSGIAIAVALVPPLAMTGIGIAALDESFALRSAGIVAVNALAVLLGAFSAVALLHKIARVRAEEEQTARS
jgi:uncharacterized hydrophobic protein (TIGR00271 family)